MIYAPAETKRSISTTASRTAFGPIQKTTMHRFHSRSLSDNPRLSEQSERRASDRTSGAERLQNLVDGGRQRQKDDQGDETDEPVRCCSWGRQSAHHAHTNGAGINQLNCVRIASRCCIPLQEPQSRCHRSVRNDRLRLGSEP